MRTWLRKAFRVLWTDENAARRWTRALLLTGGAALLGAPADVIPHRIAWIAGTALVFVGGMIHVPTASPATKKATDPPPPSP